MPRKPSGQILEHTDRNGVVSYSVRFRGQGYPTEVIRLGRSDEGMNRPRAEHEARLIASQILAGTWSPPLKADDVETEVPTIAQLVDEHYRRKVRKGLRPSSLADMKRKLELHLLPHFGHIVVTEMTSRDVEAYLDHKLAENRRIEAALAIGEPLVDSRERAMQPLRPQTINSHLHLLTEILARAVREGLIPRNPAVGEDLRLEVRREKRYGLELDEAMSLVEAAGTLDQRPGPSDELRRQIVAMRGQGKKWKAIATELDLAETTAMYHAKRAAPRPMPRFRPVVATLTLAGLRVSELCALKCEHVDLARRELRVLDAKTPAGVRRVDIHDDLQDELAAYKAARGAAWKPGMPAFLNARGKRWTRHAIAQHVIPPSLAEANRQRAKAGLPEIREEVTPHTLRYTYIASLFAAGADQEYVADQVGHEDVTTTNRIYRYVLQRRRRGEIGRRRQLAMHESAADVGRSEDLPTRTRGS
jgi:integrase/recombinase XerD